MSFRKVIPAAILLAALAPAAHAATLVGQEFIFADTLTQNSLTANNASFETMGLDPSNTTPVPTFFQHINGDTHLVSLTGFDYYSDGTKTPISGIDDVRFYISNDPANPFDDTNYFATPGGGFNDTLPGGGVVTFVGTTGVNQGKVLLQIGFTDNDLSRSHFGASEDEHPTFDGGSLYDASLSGGEDFSFGLPHHIGDASDAFYSSSFEASVGITTPVPEPAPVAALGLGALALLRRKRRA